MQNSWRILKDLACQQAGGAGSINQEIANSKISDASIDYTV